MKRKTLSMGIQVILILMSFCSGFLTHEGQAQEAYPSRSVTLLVGLSPGGAVDLTARALSDAASKILGQSIAVINKPGGTSSVALSVLMAEKPDGYMIGIMPSGGILASLLRKVPYDSVKDFSPILQYGGFQDGIAVLSDSPWKTFKEFIDYAKNNPGKIGMPLQG